MKLLYTIIVTLIMLFIITFSLVNTSPVQLKYYGFIDVSMAAYMLIFISFGVGVIFAGFMGIVERLRLSGEVKKLKKKITPKTVPAPWDAQRDHLRVDIDQAQQDLTGTQSELTQLRGSREALENSKADAQASLDEFKKTTKNQRKKNPRLALVRDQAEATLKLTEAQAAILDGDIAQAEKAAVKIGEKLDDLRQKLADRIAEETKASEDNKDEEDAAATEEGQGSEGQDGDDTQGQAADPGE